MLTELRRGATTYYLLGTAHVSKASIAEVRTTLEELRPEVVCVELDQTRLDALSGKKKPGLAEARKLVGEGKLLYLLAQLTLAAYQKRIGKRLGVRPGAEMLEAIDVAKTIDARIALIDRDIDVTLRRAWAALSLGQRAMLAASFTIGLAKTGPITEDMVEQLKDNKARAEVIDELARALPEIKSAVLDERDKYMISKMIEAAGGAKRVVAVVGAAHVPGMTAAFDLAIDRRALERIPSPSLIARTLSRLA